MTSNRKEWQMSQLLSLIHEESINKLSELTKRTYTLEEDAHSDFKQGDEVYGQASILSGGSVAFEELAYCENIKYQF